MNYTDNELNVLARLAWIGDASASFEAVAGLARLSVEDTLEACRVLVRDGLMFVGDGEIDADDVLECWIAIEGKNLRQTRAILTAASMWPPRKTATRRTDPISAAPKNATNFVDQITYTKAEACVAHSRINDAVKAGSISAISARAFKAHVTRRIAA